MSAKTETYSSLAYEASKGLTHSVNDWCMFLKSQARLYKYNYAEQLMIYAQRPDAYLCLDFDAWTKTMNRYIHKGAKGIGLVDNNGDEPKMKYVFDISDTSEKQNSRPLHIWKVNPDAEKDICKAVAEFYGMEISDNLTDTIYNACRREAREYAHSNMRDFDYILADSLLEEYDEDNRYKALYELAKSSITYVAFERCGIDPEVRLVQEDFMGVFDFNTPEVINFLGTAVSECSENVLRLVEKAEKNFERNKTNDLQNERQSSLSRTDTEQPRKDDTGEIRSDEEGISEKQEEVAVELPGSEGTTEQSPELGSDRSGKAPEIGSTGIGDNSESDLQLTLFGEPFLDTYNDDAENKHDNLFSADSIVSDERIDTILRECDNTDKTRMLVIAEFSKDKPLEDKIKFLKDVYHGGYGLLDDSGKICAFFDDEGMHLNTGTRALTKGASVLSWEQVAEIIDNMLNAGTFTDLQEIKEAPFLERSNIAKSIWYLDRDLTDEGKSLFSCLDLIHGNKGFGDEVEALAYALKSKDFTMKISEEYSNFLKEYAENKDILRFHFHKTDDIAKRLNELFMPRKEYSAVEEFACMNKYGTFITEDEIDCTICRGSGVSQGKIRITEFFEKNSNTKERAEFLKNEYGTGGSSHAVSGANHSGESHDAKGVLISKNKAMSVRLSWRDMAKKIDALIKNDKYLNPEEKIAYEKVKDEELVNALTANIKHWYCKNFPDDELGTELNPYKTFNDIVKALDSDEDVYGVLSVGDSVIRERVFAELADRMCVDYSEIYNRWLGDGPKLGTKELTPSDLKGYPLEKWDQLKEHYPKHICLMQIGDFYECFRDDAKKVSDALDLVLTGREIPGATEKVPICGFPMHNEDLYLTKLAEKGLLPVAIARTMAEKIEEHGKTSAQLEQKLPEDAAARAKPSALKKLAKAQEQVNLRKKEPPAKKQEKEI